MKQTTEQSLTAYTHLKNNKRSPTKLHSFNIPPFSQSLGSSRVSSLRGPKTRHMIFVLVASCVSGFGATFCATGEDGDDPSIAWPAWISYKNALLQSQKWGQGRKQHLPSRCEELEPRWPKCSSRYVPVLVPAIPTITVYFSFISTPMNGSVYNYLVSYSFIVFTDCKNRVMLLYYP